MCIHTLFNWAFQKGEEVVLKLYIKHMKNRKNELHVGQPISYYQCPLSSLLQEVRQRHETFPVLVLFFKAILLRLCQQTRSGCNLFNN